MRTCRPLIYKSRTVRCNTAGSNRVSAHLKTLQSRRVLNHFTFKVTKKNPNEPEFLQAVNEVADDIIPFIEANNEYRCKMLLERMIEPERTIIFRVPWTADDGSIHVNRGFRIEYNSAIGPYKGGLRFHPNVNLSILKFLGFEQMFKNALTSLPLGGGKGGADFDPKGKSDDEVMRFCQSFMTELARHIGPNTDVPAGDIGVGSREIGYMFGQYKRQRNEFTGVLTGKGLSYGGSFIRPEATGYGLIYFVENMLASSGQESLNNMVVAISGSGNVAQYACEKAILKGAKVVTMSDSTGYIYDPDGIDNEKLSYIKNIKNVKRSGISAYTQLFPNASFHPDMRPWNVACDIALPCATQNEIEHDDAAALVMNKVRLVAEGANMPTSPGAIDVFKRASIPFAPGKASNAGGVAVSGLEMSQNSMRIYWIDDDVDIKLQQIMKNIHDVCALHGREHDGRINYIKGANIAGFVKIADAMLAQGVV